MKPFADYKMILDHPLVLLLPGAPTQSISFELPADTMLPTPSGDGTAQQRPLIMFSAKPDNPTNLECSVTINGTPALDMVFNSSERRTIHEAVGGNRFVVGTNTIEFTATGGVGGVNVSDIIIWFQRK